MATAKRTAAKKKRAAAPRANKAQPIALLIATRKGAFILKSDGARRTWKTTGPFFLGQIVHHIVLDPRDRRTQLASTSTGHLGPTMMKSTDHGRPPNAVCASQSSSARARWLYWIGRPAR